MIFDNMKKGPVNNLFLAERWFEQSWVPGIARLDNELCIVLAGTQVGSNHAVIKLATF